MEFQNEFDVEAPIDEVWEAMLDLERVAPAMPGAQVLEKIDDDNYKVAIKVKVGPVSMQYRGDVTFADKDPANHRATMKVKAREARGQGQATAQVGMHLDETGPGKTHGAMKADVQLSGKAASMGRGIIQDVSSRLVEQFAGNLATMLAGPKEAAPAAAAAASTNGAPAEPEKGATAEHAAVSSTAETSEQPAVAAGAGGTGGGGGAGGAAAAAAAAAEAPKQEAPKQQPRPQPQQAEAELDAMALGVSMAKDRVRDPKVIAILVAFVLGWLVGRRSG